MAQITAQDVSLLEKFKMQAREFAEAFRTLLDAEPYVSDKPELRGEFEELYDSGLTIKNTVDKVTRTVDAVTGYFKDSFGLDGVRRGGALGVLPLVPIAAITAAIAYMSGWGAEVYMFERKVTESKRLESQGVDPREAAAIASGMQDDESPISQAIKDIAKPAGVALGFYLLVQLFRNPNPR